MRPGAAVEAARHERARTVVAVATASAVEAVVEAGAAAIAAGATDPGIASLRGAVALADGTGVAGLRVRSRLALAEALIHAVRGQDEEGQAHLHEVDRLALQDGDLAVVAQARAELGYVDFLRARYDRAERWLTDAVDLARSSPAVLAKATSYLGSVYSDLGSYPQAVDLLEGAVRVAGVADDPRRAAYALSMHGRVDLLCGRLDDAAVRLAESVALAERGHWLSFLPWPEALQGELHLARQEPGAAAQVLERAFARACQLGDPCWEGMAARGTGPGGGVGRPHRARPSTPCSTPAAAATGSPTPTSGSTRTSSTPCARWAARHSHPQTRALGRRDARAGLPHRDARAHRAGAAALGGPGGCR